MEAEPSARSGDISSLVDTMSQSKQPTPSNFDARRAYERAGTPKAAHHMIHQAPESLQVYQQQQQTPPTSRVKRHDAKVSSNGHLQPCPAIQAPETHLAARKVGASLEQAAGQCQTQYQDRLNRIRERLFRLLSKVPIQVGGDFSASLPTHSTSSSSSASSSSSSSSSSTVVMATGLALEQTTSRASTSSSSVESSATSSRLIDGEPLVIKYYNERSLGDIINLHFACSLTKHNFERGLSIKQVVDEVTACQTGSETARSLANSIASSTQVCYNPNQAGYPQDYHSEQHWAYQPAGTTSERPLLGQAGWQASDNAGSWPPAAECHFTASAADLYYQQERLDDKLMNNYNHDDSSTSLKATKVAVAAEQQSKRQFSATAPQSVAVCSPQAKRTRRQANYLGGSGSRAAQQQQQQLQPFDKLGSSSAKMAAQTILFEPSSAYDGPMLVGPPEHVVGTGQGGGGGHYADQFQTYPLQADSTLGFHSAQDLKPMDTTCSPFQHQQPSSSEPPVQVSYQVEQGHAYQPGDHFEAHYYQHLPPDAYQQQAVDSCGNWLSQQPADELDQQQQQRIQLHHQPRMIDQHAPIEGPISETANCYGELGRERGLYLAAPSYFVYAAERQPLELAQANQSAL